MKIKSIFISAFPAIAVFSLFYSISIFANNGFSIQTLGSFICAFTISSMFLLAFTSSKAKKMASVNSRKNANLPPVTIAVLIGMIICLAGAFIEEDKHYLIIGLAGINTINWLLYIGWYSKFTSRNKNEILKVGNVLPVLTLENHLYEKMSSENFLGAPTIFIFYRGNWCPLCMVQITEIVKEYQELEKRGVKTVLISPQPHKNTEVLAKKFKVGFNFLVDKNNTVAKQLNIFDKGALPFGFQALGYDTDMVMPTVIITDKKGEIVFIDLTDNYRVRPEPSTFLKIIDNLN